MRWFCERGLHAWVGGSMATGGATAPVTLAGMVTLTIAEPCCSACCTTRSMATGAGASAGCGRTLDPRTMMRPLAGRTWPLPTSSARRWRGAIARAFPGCAASATRRAPRPRRRRKRCRARCRHRCRAGQASIEAGLLGIDEVYSPVQIVLDDALTHALAQFTHEYEISDETIGADLVEALGPDGNFAAEEHTGVVPARAMGADALETPPLCRLAGQDGRSDVERARERVLAILGAVRRRARCSTRKRALRRIIERANRRGAALETSNTKDRVGLQA